MLSAEMVHIYMLHLHRQTYLFILEGKEYQIHMCIQIHNEADISFQKYIGVKKYKIYINE